VSSLVSPLESLVPSSATEGEETVFLRGRLTAAADGVGEGESS